MNPRHRRSPRNLTMNKAYPEWYDSKGIFSSMTTAPWASEVSLSSIDVAYHGEHSGGKFVAPLIYHFVDDDGEITEAGKTAVANMLLNRYGAKWEHLWGLYTMEYGILDSYNLVETRHREASATEELDNTHTVQRTDTYNHPTKTTEIDSTRTPDLEESTTVDEEVVVDASDLRTANLAEETEFNEATSRDVDETTTVTHGHVVTTDNDTTDSVEDSKHGFNSAVGVSTTGSSSTGTSDTTETHSGNDVTVVDSSEAGTKTGTDTKTTTGTDRHDEDSTTTKDGTTVKSTSGTETYAETEVERYSGTDSLVKTGSEADAREGSTNEEEDATTTKTGNIFKSPAELMMADRDFWLTDFFSIVFEDVDQMITLAIYPERTVQHTVLSE